MTATIVPLTEEETAEFLKHGGIGIDAARDAIEALGEAAQAASGAPDVKRSPMNRQERRAAARRGAKVAA